MLGGSAAALAGLLFVAMSIHLDDVLKVPFLRTFARNNTIAMIVLVVRAAAILIPQSHVMLALELILLDGFGVVMASTVLIWGGRRMLRGRKFRAAATVLSSVLGAAGPASLVSEIGGGMYVITAAYLILFCVILSSAWALMTGIYQSDHRSKRR